MLGRFIKLSGFFIALSLWLLACGADTAPQIVPNEPATPTQTVTPSITPAPIVGILPTSTPVPEATRDTSIEVTVGPSPTSPLRPTFTPEPPTVTPTKPAATATPDIVIEYFRSNSTSIEPNGNVTLSWSVVGAEEIVIYRLSPNGLREREWPVGESGSITVSSNAPDFARFELEAEAGGLSEISRLSLTVGCGETWFFSPAPSGCPSSAANLSLHVEQTFEGGRMIWIQGGRDVYVIFTDSETPQWQQYIDQYTDGQPASDPGLVPPSPGLIQPVRGFGLIWREQTRVRERLGWATTPEISYDGAVQDSVTATYVRSQQGGILQLNAGGSSWTTLVGSPANIPGPTTPTATPNLTATSAPE